MIGTVVDEIGNAGGELKVQTDEQDYRMLFRDLANLTAVFEAGRNWHYIAGLLTVGKQHAPKRWQMLSRPYHQTKQYFG